MRKNEEAALEEFKRDGWSAMRNGWPDYLLVRANDDGKLEFMGLEVKCDGDVLNEAQAGMHAVLIAAGIKVEVRKVRKSPVPRGE